MDYPLENLGDDRFQLLCQALLVKEYPGIVCYPLGMADGGRDAVQMNASGTTNSILVFQVKFTKNPNQKRRNWVVDAVKGEKLNVSGLRKIGAIKYVLITNLPGTAALEVGTMDQLHTELSEMLDIPVQCWWRDDINRRLDGSWDLKLRYPEILTGQDFLRLIVGTSAETNHSRRWNAARAFLVEQFQEDQEVKFKQVELQNKLLDLFVDLPFQLGRNHGRSKSKKKFEANEVARIEEGQLELRPEISSETSSVDGTASLILSRTGGELTAQMVIEGAPGQGKSTLAQYLCQVHRIKLLGKRREYAQLPELHRRSPVSLPIKVDLRDVSEWLSGLDPFLPTDQHGKEIFDRTVEAFLCRLISLKAGGISFVVNDLIEIAKNIPLFIAFDGLDEVADIRRRADVVSQVTKAVFRLKENCPGFRSIVTSRPAAFVNSPGFEQKHFPYLQLGSVKREQIDKYAAKWMDARKLNTRERKEFEAILNEKLDQPHLRDLSRNPMQLTILLSLIHTKGSALPDKRTTLYDAYVDLFFSRESTKNSTVRTHLELLKDIHRYLAWILHSRAEAGRGPGSDGRVTSNELKKILTEYLNKEQRGIEIIEDIFNAMLERVVMIVSRIEGTHEFEVQPLREYFAARYLYDTAPYSPAGKERTGTKPDRFDAISRNNYWLNVTRFFCGCFSKGELLDLADRIEDLMKDPEHGRTRHPFLLSVMLLSDSVFSQSHKATTQLASLIFSPEGLRRITPVGIGYRNEEPVRIANVTREMERRIFDYYCEESVGNSDLQRPLGQLVQANVGGESILSLWRAARNRFLSLEDWLRAGYFLDILDGLGAEKVNEIICGNVLGRNAINLLWLSGYSELLVQSPEHTASIENFLLSEAVYWSDDESANAPFFLLRALLYLASDYHYNEEPKGMELHLRRAISAFKKNFSGQSYAQRLNKVNFDDRCFCLSLSISLLLEQENADGGSAGFWRGVVDVFFSEFGLRPMVVALALRVIAVEGYADEPRRCGLFDESIPLLERVAYAKKASGRWGFWEGSFKAKLDFSQRAMLSVLFLAFAPTQMAMENQDRLAEFFDGIPLDEWNSIVRAGMDLAHGVMRRGGLKKSASQNIRLSSARFAFLMSVRDSGIAKQAFLTNVLHCAGNHPYVQNLCRQQAVRCAVSGDISWEDALAYLKRDKFYSPGYLDFEDAKPPPEIVDVVLQNPRLYPGRLWDQLQMIAADSISKSGKTIGAIARRERWFDR